jgi:hypothetical protein
MSEKIDLVPVWRQGDVVVLRNVTIPKTAKEIKHDGVLALGEVTGHKHQVVGPKVRYFMDDNKPDQLFFKVESRFATLNHGLGSGKADVPTVKHEDDPVAKEEGHYTHELPVGDYVRVQQSQFDFLSETLRIAED